MEDFVPFLLAKKLKEKGFTLPKSNVVGKFDSDGVFHSQLYINFTETMDSEEIIAPTIAQVLKWLRKEHQIHIFVDITSVGWYPKVSTKVKLDETRFWFSKAPFFESDFFDTYEEAVLATIEYVIDKLI